MRILTKKRFYVDLEYGKYVVYDNRFNVELKRFDTLDGVENFISEEECYAKVRLNNVYKAYKTQRKIAKKKRRPFTLYECEHCKFWHTSFSKPKKNNSGAVEIDPFGFCVFLDVSTKEACDTIANLRDTYKRVREKEHIDGK